MVRDTINAIMAGRVLRHLARSSEDNRPVDVYSFFSGVGKDFITAYIFGTRNGTNFIEHDIARNQCRVMAFWCQESPATKRLLDTFGLHVIPR